MNQIEQIALKEIYNAAKNKQLDQVRAWVQFLDKAPKMKTHQYYGKRRAPVRKVTLTKHVPKVQSRTMQHRTIIRASLYKGAKSIKEIHEDTRIGLSTIWANLQRMKKIERSKSEKGYVYSVKNKEE